jgi:tetratricopeptide (TPR) repeat protein
MGAKDDIAKAEKIIENAVWESQEREDLDWELGEYRKATGILTGLDDLPDDVVKERKRVLSYCLMRIDEVLVNLDQTEGAVRRAQESLDLAVASEDTVQIARSKLALGVRLLNEGKLPEAESHFGDIIKEGLDSEDPDMKQVTGWALLVRVNILMGKSLYNQALIVAQDAAGILSGINNYAGLANAYSLISKLHFAEGNPDQGEEAKSMSESFSKMAKEHRQ